MKIISNKKIKQKSKGIKKEKDRKKRKKTEKKQNFFSRV